MGMHTVVGPNHACPAHSPQYVWVGLDALVVVGLEVVNVVFDVEVAEVLLVVDVVLVELELELLRLPPTPDA
jgi:hypothetical protein